MRSDPIRVFRVTVDIHYNPFNGFAFRCTKEFTDVYDFADWLKQRELRNQKTTVYCWDYGYAAI